MDGETPPEPGEAHKSGCGKWIAGCGVLLLVAAIGVGYLVMKGPQLLRWGGAKVVVAMVETVVEEGLQLPEEDRDAVMVPVRELADRVVEGEVETEVAVAALGQALESNEAAVVVLHSFESRYVDSELIPAEQREESLLTANRFASGILDRRIPRSYLEPLSELVIEERTGEDGSHEVRVKEQLSAEDVNAALVIMRQAVAEHGVDDPYHERTPAELSAMVDRAIERALVEVRAEGTHGIGPVDESVPPGERGSEPRPLPEPRQGEEDLGPAL